MNQSQNKIKETDQKDTQRSIEKGQKILAALYLVTNHLPETDPLRQDLRSAATRLVDASVSNKKTSAQTITILLGGAVFAGLISEKNSSVIVYEVDRFVESYDNTRTGEVLEVLFAHRESGSVSSLGTIKDIKKTSISTLVHSPHKGHIGVQYTKNTIQKNSRQDTILSFINDRKSAVIKDIVSLFPDVSEKTIQRELTAMIDSGKITKRGSKRWSIYMAVNTLL
jgi:hypothetical protein